MKKLTDRDFGTFYKINEFVAKTTPMRTHYNSKNPVERWLWQRKKQIIKQMTESITYNKVLDIGCGDGGLLELVRKDSTYTGVDISPTQLSAFRKLLKQSKRNNVKLVQSDVSKLPFGDNIFDLVFACDVLEHVLNPIKVLKEIQRVTKKNGYIIFSIPNERLLQLGRLATLRFPLRSPDHLYALGVEDVKLYFPDVVGYCGIPMPLSQTLSLINILLVQNGDHEV